jgi:hypothetical protein
LGEGSKASSRLVAHHDTDVVNLPPLQSTAYITFLDAHLVVEILCNLASTFFHHSHGTVLEFKLQSGELTI